MESVKSVATFDYMLNYLKESFRRKKARRVTQEYGPIMEQFQLSQDGTIDFANWDLSLIHI